MSKHIRESVISQLIKSTVMIVKYDKQLRNNPKGFPTIKWEDVQHGFIGTGFLISYNKRFFMITNRHVVTGCDKGGNPKNPRPNLIVLYRALTQSGYSWVSIDQIHEKFKFNWVFADHIPSTKCEIDLAITPIALDRAILDVYYGETKHFGKWGDYKAGDDIFFVGFPLGPSPSFEFQPAIRNGIISCKIDSKKEYLLDAVSVGGSSGSPVFNKTLFFDKDGKTRVRPMRLIGVVSEHVELLREPPFSARDNQNPFLSRALAISHIESLLKKV